MQGQSPRRDVSAVSPRGLTEHRLRHLYSVNAARRTDTVKKEFQAHAASEADVGHRRCLAGLQRLRCARHQVSVAAIERGANEAPAQTTRMTELIGYARHEGIPNAHLHDGKARMSNRHGHDMN